MILLGATAAARAAEIELMDGRKIRGEVLEKGATSVTLMLADGTTETFAFEEILGADWKGAEDPAAKKHADREKKKRARERLREAQRLLDDYAKLSPSAREEVGRTIDGYALADRLALLSKAIYSSQPALRDFALDRLERLEAEPAVLPIIYSALTCPDAEFAKRANEKATQKDVESARTVYEYAAERKDTVPEYRLRALEHLQTIGDPRSVPAILGASVVVTTDVRLSLARLKGFREVPVSLGSLEQAATNVDLELPEIELIEVNTTAAIPVELSRQLHGQVFSALRSVSGRDFGEDLGAWADWWQTEGKKSLAPKPDAGDAGPTEKPSER